MLTGVDNHVGNPTEMSYLYIITCSAVVLYADWSIGVRPGAVHTLKIQYRKTEFDIERQNSMLPLGQQPRFELQSYFEFFCDVFVIF